MLLAGSTEVWNATWVAKTPREAIARSPSSELMNPRWRMGAYDWVDIISTCEFSGKVWAVFNYLKDGYKVRAGASEMSFWYDCWLSDGFLCEKVPYVNIQDTTLLIKDVC